LGRSVADPTKVFFLNFFSLSNKHANLPAKIGKKSLLAKKYSFIRLAPDHFFSFGDIHQSPAGLG
jgi:hypothetical protein